MTPVCERKITLPGDDGQDRPPVCRSTHRCPISFAPFPHDTVLSAMRRSVTGNGFGRKSMTALFRKAEFV